MKYLVLVSYILIIALLACAGCSDEQGPDDSSIPETPPQDAQYVAGDIVAKTATQAEPLWLILSYNKNTDRYERTFVYKKTDGTWGYRKDTVSDMFPRMDMEKLYPIKVAHVTVTSVPFITPTGTATPYATEIPTGPSPEITSITPTTGVKGMSATASIAGKNFLPGATVKLIRAGASAITADQVRAMDARIVCVFNFYGASAGEYDLVVINPDGKSATLPNAFSISENAPIISSINPFLGNTGETLTLSIRGSNFKNPAKVFLNNKGVEIEGENVKVASSTSITCVVRIPTGVPTGEWDVIVRNIADQQNGTLFKKFTVRNAT